MIKSGRLRDRVRIEKRSTSQDEAGEPLATWTLVAERWVEIVQAKGREIFASAQRQGRIPTVIRLRQIDGVVPSMRVRWGSRLFNITSVYSPAKGETLLECDEEVSG